tara:strand:- start:6423 stop:7292 length:870 start_codon:yes stop_codon:yes gene_type:complete
MSQDHYKTLGVPEQASQDEIKRAYKKLAKQHHPDLNGGNDTEFKKVNEANNTLSDDKKRQQYDIERRFGAQGGQGPFNFGGGVDDIIIDTDGFGNMFEQFFGGPNMRQTFRQRQTKPLRNQDIRISLSVSLEDVYHGNTKEVIIKTPDGSNQNVKIHIPKACDSGTQIKFTGLGSKQYEDLRPGDLYAVLNINAHKNFTKKGNDLLTNLDVNIFDALLGTKVDLQHFDNIIAVTIPPLTQPDDIVRVKGKGMALNNGTHGNLYIKLNYKMPKNLTDEQKDLIKQIKDKG